MRLASLTAWIALLVCAAAGAANVTSTTHYRWRDAQGVVHFGDTIPPEAVPLGYDIVNDQGLVVRHVDRQKTAAERAAAAAETARQAAAKRAVQQQALNDSQLLAAYPDEAGLREAHDAKLAQMQQSIDATQANLRSQEQSLADLLARAAELERNNQPVPPYLHKRVADQRQSVADERNEILRMQNERAQTAKQFDAELLHYRELRAKEQQAEAGGN
ncbi:MAG: DUF4124 domain-containing protein [Proteobacteria bacterium]|nr:DUF4124 domain-containing protein [Pseudomonadota bacterium]